MAKYTLLKLKDGLALEQIKDDLIRNSRNDLTPPGEWPATEKIYAEMLPFQNTFEISEVETKIVFPDVYDIETTEEDIMELEEYMTSSETEIAASFSTDMENHDLERTYLAYHLEETTTAKEISAVDDNVVKIIEKNEQMLFSYIRIIRSRDDWYDDRTEELLPFDKRINVHESEALFFESGNSCYAAIKGSPNSQKVTRVKKDLLLSKGFLQFPRGLKTELVGLPSEFRLDSDLFYWMYYIYKEKGKIIRNLPDPIFIIELNGFSGTSLLNTQRTKSNGDRITQLLTTSAFIFKKDDLQALKVTLQYGREHLYIELNNDGSVDIIRHIGEYSKASVMKRQSELIFVYKVIIPLLMAAYEDDIKNKLWGPDILRGFITDIGNEMISTITRNIQKQVRDVLSS